MWALIPITCVPLCVFMRLNRGSNSELKLVSPQIVSALFVGGASAARATRCDRSELKSTITNPLELLVRLLASI